MVGNDRAITFVADHPVRKPALMSDATSMTVEVTATISVRQTVNIVDLFQKMDERAQDRYRDLDIAELGMEAEWERPLAYLWPDEDDLIPYQLAAGARSPVRGDISSSQVRVEKRGLTSVHGRDGDWSEGDFETLTAQVPWLRLFHDKLNTPLTQHELARVPGPDDVPMF